MINLFEHFDHQAQTLYTTLQLAGYKHETIVLEDNGFLPASIITPYRYFAEYQISDNAKSRYFNQIDIPRYWEIDGNNSEAMIKDMGKVRGEIRYHQGLKPRIVDRVEWIDEQGRLQYVDHYTQEGVCFAKTVYNLKGEKIFRRYLDQQGYEVIYENYVAQSIILNWQGKSHHFSDKVEFLQFFINSLQLDLNGFIINSLGMPFLLSYRLDMHGNDILFWQEQSDGNVPGNMKLMLENHHTRQYRVVVPDLQEYDVLTQQMSAAERQYVFKGGYIYDYKRQNMYQPKVVTMTNSDQLPHIEAIVEACPNATFHIGAVTEMSDKLMAMERYDNVKLFPAIEIGTVNQLYQSCDIYLDINEGGEIINAVRRAFDHDLLVLGYEQNAHNKAVTAPENLFSKEGQGVSELIQALKDIQRKPRYFKARQTYQKAHVHEVSVKDFNRVMSQLFK
ncbi:accessory Sec system glycosylation chaperone GtfB [Staphylococcus muscae]|uniref:UDP-N-acetylglucosamine--peptide N-acetylglucosaminyltransferase stabilizing protein GtfB n=1 Tax=Staphylococcus muscae TaxID=1294 RepID=A0A240BRS9_9STAP|nr:accessory Sec system glycosylation chaperone GtfB [Staphylococcus muscae]AVQ34047.1 accessory Sec system glycosylation chaperone GtfB [Staphylococcus muscae]PNZ05693.1 accessory Sec system glycosylation chaperone GtfB [Staphylococcus muscae]GGA82173.1 glycosyltransferase stabilizing protein Gtf2 [Staphylococcus muscae]SNV98537.1 accessory Sec system glycosyltransferase GtfB [Staphylococcus muscae]